MTENFEYDVRETPFAVCEADLSDGELEECVRTLATPRKTYVYLSAISGAALIASFADSGYDAIIPISAKTGDGLDILTRTLAGKLPEGPKYFPDDMMTDQPERQIVAEMIREKALLHLRDEVPHGIGVEIMGMNKESDDFMEIHATIYCERDAHKGIIIGKRGAMLQQIGSEARQDI